MDNKMDGFIGDHSDSDSGESWTILDNTPSHGDPAPDFPETIIHKDGDITDKDEDTDGISIISESEAESSSTPEQLNYDMLKEEPAQEHIEEVLIETANVEEHVSCDDLLTNTVKNKTYVHRRNKKLSTVLNLIVLFSVITAVGVAIGHMWGVRDDCAQHSLTNINKILSKLYKLQEENVILRNKIRELTLANTLQFQYKKDDFINPPAFKQKCRKVFEESLANKYAKTPKCVMFVDESGNPVNNNRVDQTIENLNVIDKVNLDKGENIAREKRDNNIIYSKDQIEHNVHRKIDLDLNTERLVEPKNARPYPYPMPKGDYGKYSFPKLKKDKKQKYKKYSKIERRGDNFNDHVIIEKDTQEKNARNENDTRRKYDPKKVESLKYNPKTKDEKENFDYWYEKRALHRMESRKKGETNQDGQDNWYLRRMNKREQCRSKPVNLTNKKATHKNAKN